MIGIGRGFKRV